MFCLAVTYSRLSTRLLAGLPSRWCTCHACSLGVPKKGDSDHSVHVVHLLQNIDSEISTVMQTSLA